MPAQTRNASRSYLLLTAGYPDPCHSVATKICRGRLSLCSKGLHKVDGGRLGQISSVHSDKPHKRARAHGRICFQYLPALNHEAQTNLKLHKGLEFRGFRVYGV